MFYRVVAVVLYALLIVPGAVHFPSMWIMVLLAPAWLLMVFWLEERRVRRTVGQELREAVSRLPLDSSRR